MATKLQYKATALSTPFECKSRVAILPCKGLVSSRIRRFQVTDKGFTNEETLLTTRIGTHGNLEGIAVLEQDDVLAVVRRQGPGVTPTLAPLVRQVGPDAAPGELANAGQVVGYFQTKLSPMAFLWQDGQMIDLNELVDSGRKNYLKSASGINDAGHIVGLIRIQLRGGDAEEHGFLLIPNEP